MTVEIEKMIDRMETVAARIDSATTGNGQVQTVIHKSDAGGFLTGVAVTSCVACIFLILAFMIVENRSYEKLSKEIDDLKAWSDVHGNDIARLQAAQEAKK